MTDPTTVRVRAFAKINLLLGVGPRQTDGFHPLETVFQSLALHDTVTCTATRGPLVVTCDDPAVPTNGTNLAYKAASALWRAMGRSGVPRRCAIAISKHVPSAAGLGGGSADAAAAIVACHRVWRGSLSASALMNVAAEVGADVPYFLVGGTAIGLGRGDRLYPLPDIAPRWVVLACPPVGVSTAEAYGWFDEDRRRRRVRAMSTIDAWDSLPLLITNDLQGPVARRHPRIAALVAVLDAAGAEAAAMTGSGSAVFGLFEDETTGREAAHAAAGIGAHAIFTRTASRAWCRRAFGVADARPAGGRLA
jgi:4-diphosphocytidyl-2-C-methyl-D-erythritol kinase